jgi:site-specific recombinase XerD
MTEPGTTALIPTPTARLIPASSNQTLPALIAEAAPAAGFAWEEFFNASIRNPHTRAAYRRAVKRFLSWAEPQGVPLAKITPGMVGTYFNQLQGSPAKRKLYLAALRGFFDALVIRHVVVLNPAASVRGERYQVIEGKTPEITVEQARTLMKSIHTVTAVGLRDLAIIAVLIYTAARAGAVARLCHKHFANDGSQWTLRFEEKGGKSREIPVRHDLQLLLLDYLKAADPHGRAPGDMPLFRSAFRNTGRLTAKAITGLDICRLVKRRLHDAGLPSRLSPHSFRVATVTDLLTQGVPLEDVQYLAGHADPRTTRLYDRRQKSVTRNTVEKISI